MEYAIEVDGLTKKYEGFMLDHVSFQIPKGSIVGFIGENGAGKSTTIKAILNLIHADEGTVKVLGKENDPADLALKEQIGVAFDESYFPENLKLRQISNILKNLYKNWEEEKFWDYCQRFHLPEKKVYKEFSKGMKMKLSIAVALSHQAKLLILDEATSGLDPVVRNEILDIFLDFIQEEDHTVFLSSHITSDIEKISDYILLIHEGKILLFENKDELLYEYGMVRCSDAQLAKLDQAKILGIRKNAFETEVLVKNRRELEIMYPELVVDQVTIEEILLYIVKNHTIVR